MAKKGRTAELFKKYGKDKNEGFRTRSTKDLKKERDDIKKSYYAKGAFVFFATLVLLSLLKFVTGDYKDVHAQNAAAVKPLEDSIDAGEGDPSLEIMKDQLESLKKGQDQIKDEYDKKLIESASEYQKKIDALTKELESRKNIPLLPTTNEKSVDEEQVRR